MTKQIYLALGLSLCALASLRAAEPELQKQKQEDRNRVSVKARIGFNVDVRFKNFGPLSAVPNGRTTPNGDNYNYDDGYVLRDVSDNYGGETWYWGYDNASQVSGNTILMSRSQALRGSPSPNGIDNGDALPGAEIAYNRELGRSEKLRWGIELAASYMNVCFDDGAGYRAATRRTTDAYPFHDGTTPPMADYQGSYDGPGFVLGDTPVSSSTRTIRNGATVEGEREFDANIWGFRLGPYIEVPLGTNWAVSFSAGLAVGVVNAKASWDERISIGGRAIATSRGSGDDTDVLLGGYAGASLLYRVSARWSVEVGAQFQAMSGYEGDLGGRRVDMDLGRTVFVTAGVGYTF